MCVVSCTIYCLNAPECYQDVKAVLVSIIASKGGLREVEAEKVLLQKANSGRFLLECWW